MKFSVISTVLAATSDTADPGDVLRLDDYLVETNPATFDPKAPAVTQPILGSDLKELNLAATVEPFAIRPTSSFANETSSPKSTGKPNPSDDSCTLSLKIIRR